MGTVKYFKATKKTNRFNENQKVWIRHEFANHLWLFFKYRGKGRCIEGICDKFSNFVGEIKTIDVDDNFADRIHGNFKGV